MSQALRVIVLGSGFGGLRAAQALKSESGDVTLIDRRNYHLSQPLLYQIPTSSLSPGHKEVAVNGGASEINGDRVSVAQ